LITTGTVTHIETRPLSCGPAVQILSITLTDPFPFEAGQYLEIVHPDGTAIPLSIASPPERLPTLSLHYRSTPDSAEALRMDALISGLISGPRSGLLGAKASLTIRGPAGDVRLAPEDDAPLLLVCGGTGVSQSLCLATAQRRRHPETAVELLACADHAADFYFEDLLPDGLAATLIADPERTDSNRGLAWLRSRVPSLDGRTRVIISGSPPFVWAVTDVLTAGGLPPGRLSSDVYAWAPRS